MCHNSALDSGRETTTIRARDGTISEMVKIPLTSHVFVEQENPSVTALNGQNIDKRMYAYVRADPTDEQESMLKHWSLLPFYRVPWYDVYEQAKDERRLQQQPSQATSPTSTTSKSITKSSPPTAEHGGKA